MKLSLHRKKTPNVSKIMQSYKKRHFDRWIALLAISFLLLIGVFIFSLYLFSYMSKAGFSKQEDAAADSPEAIAREQLDAVLLYFAKRKEKTDTLLQNPLIIQDPSV